MSGSHSTPIEAQKHQTSFNPDSVSKQGQFSAKKPSDKPMTTHGHQPGQITSPTDTIPTHHASSYPPGTAPKNRSFAPNNDPDALNSGPVDMPGATSADLHTGLGHPGQGMTSNEIRHDGQKKRKNQGTGLTRFGKNSDLNAADGRIDESQRALDKDVPTGRGPGFKAEGDGASGRVKDSA
ncbi:hypothetical protein EDC01DRAFT_631652 [Geopyxis carbonaria]|nr:hypothetical protein EDC01DRAFT_631652 [Geopyxis carbonaria]